MEHVKFGICVPQDGMTYEDIKNTAIRCEELGFDSIWLFDHLHAFPRPDMAPFIECWTTLSALAEATERIRLGSLVLNCQYRNPALLAKMAATLDNISNGRLEFGIGAGGTTRSGLSAKIGYTPEYDAYGTDFLEGPRLRIRRLEEAVQIIRTLWTEDNVTFTGKYYRTKNAFSHPKPIQKPHPPIWIGGTGGKLILKIVAKYADGCNLGWNFSPDDYERRLRILTEYCNDFGRSISQIRKSYLTACAIGETADQLRKSLNEILSNELVDQEFVPYALRRGAITGTSDECVRLISKFKEIGVTHLVLFFPNIADIETFAEKVISSF